MAGEEIWNDVLFRIETKVNRHSFHTWFRPMRFVDDDGGTLRIAVDHELHQTWMLKHYRDVIDDAIKESGHDVRLQLIVRPADSPSGKVGLSTIAR